MEAISAAGAADESELLARLRAGDDRAYERLVVEQGGRLLAVARRFLRNEEDARDCLQECFVQAFRALPRFEGSSKLSQPGSTVSWSTRRS